MLPAVYVRAAIARGASPQPPHSLESLGFLLQARGDLDQAESSYRKALVRRPSERVNEPYFSKTRDLLGKVAGLELVVIDRPDEYCGFGGSFCVTDEAVSAKMGYDQAYRPISEPRVPFWSAPQARASKNRTPNW